MKKDVFISYSSTDFDTVNSIKVVLETNQISCWMAPSSIPPGSSYAYEIPNAIKNCTIFLLMLSERSQVSQWVPKELSLALSAGKTVLPYMIEKCELTDTFNFFLTDVQRFEIFESQSENLKHLINRIKAECCSTSPKIILPNDDKSMDIEVAPIDKWIISIDPRILEKELAKSLTIIRKKYFQSPNAQIINCWLNELKIEKYNILNVLDTISKFRLNIFNAAEVYVQLALINVHSGEKNYIISAREYLDKAINIYFKNNHYDSEVFKKIVYSKWLTAVTYKQNRNFGIASDICNELIDYVNDENEIFGCSYSETLLLPQRELAVINKEELLCDFLLSKTSEIQYNVKELFFTQKRLFEFFILNNDFDKARTLLPELLSSYDKCKVNIDAIYQIALYQNLFEYYTYTGDTDKAEEYYRLAFSKAKQNFWEGKKKKLENLKIILQ